MLRDQKQKKNALKKKSTRQTTAARLLGVVVKVNNFHNWRSKLLDTQQAISFAQGTRVVKF